MANFVTIEAEARERAGKGAARASRRAGMVPAIIYGAKQTPTLIQLDPRIIVRELTRGGWKSRLYEINVAGAEAGAQAGATSRALMREVQFHPVSATRRSTWTSSAWRRASASASPSPCSSRTRRPRPA